MTTSDRETPPFAHLEKRTGTRPFKPSPASTKRPSPRVPGSLLRALPHGWHRSCKRAIRTVRKLCAGPLERAVEWRPKRRRGAVRKGAWLALLCLSLTAAGRGKKGRLGAEETDLRRQTRIDNFLHGTETVWKANSGMGEILATMDGKVRGPFYAVRRLFLEKFGDNESTDVDKKVQLLPIAKGTESRIDVFMKLRAFENKGLKILDPNRVKRVIGRLRSRLQTSLERGHATLGPLHRELIEVEKWSSLAGPTHQALFLEISEAVIETQVVLETLDQGLPFLGPAALRARLELSRIQDALNAITLGRALPREETLLAVIDDVAHLYVEVAELMGRLSQLAHDPDARKPYLQFMKVFDAVRKNESLAGYGAQ